MVPAAGAGGAEPTAAWKQNMIVLLLLYPVVFLFGLFVQTPLLTGRAGLHFAIALFIGNVASVILLNYLVPWTSTGFSWWLRPSAARRRLIEIAGTALVVALYAADGGRVLAIDDSGGAVGRPPAGDTCSDEHEMRTELGGGRREKHALFPSSNVATIRAMRLP